MTRRQPDVEQQKLFSEPAEPPPPLPQATQSDVTPQEPPPDFSALEGFIGAWGKR